MKQNPNLQRIQGTMVNGPLAEYRFLGDDTRNLVDIINDDNMLIAELGASHAAIARRLKYFTEIGRAHLGCPVVVDDVFEVIAGDHKGFVPCPFGDNHNSSKCNVKVTNLQLNKAIHWSDLNIHMIEQHGFYEGKGARFRVEPNKVVEVLGLTGGEGVEALEFAMQMELEGKEFYLKAAEAANNLQVKEVFQALAADEQRHYQVVKGMLESGNYQYDGSGATKDLKVVFVDELQLKQLKQDASEVEAYQLAIDFEIKSVELYQELATKARSNKEKEVFLKLAKEEEGHRLILWKLLELMRRSEEWYPYLDI